jgi:hypothetical protein
MGAQKWRRWRSCDKSGDCQRTNQVKKQQNLMKKDEMSF